MSELNFKLGQLSVVLYSKSRIENINKEFINIAYKEYELLKKALDGTNNSGNISNEELRILDEKLGGLIMFVENIEINTLNYAYSYVNNAMDDYNIIFDRLGYYFNDVFYPYKID
ncbi:MAG: hypothetical protein KC505_07745, partial [Myxococcales bacterium]|nr:hypothetical protein [Myxococcales bacterium]